MYKDVPDALHLAVTVACSTARARELLVTPRGLNTWLTVDADIASAIGAPVRLRLSSGEVVEGSVKGFDSSSGIAYSFVHDVVRRAFGETVVRWSWESLSPDFSVVTVTHTGHGQGDIWQRAYEHHLNLWVNALRNLAAVVNEGRDLRSKPVAS